jgi:hypothetical protein
MIRPATVIAGAVAVAACGGGDRAARAVPPRASRDCGRARGDSARAVCLALNEVERIDTFRAEAFRLERYGDTICVQLARDSKRYPRMLDGGTAMAVLRGRVVATMTGDSVPCPHG